MSTKAAAAVELDFFGMEKDNNSSSSSSSIRTTTSHNLLNRQRSFRDIQSAISKINPEVLKSVISSATANQIPENGAATAHHSKKPFPREEQSPFLPIYTSLPRPALDNPPAETAPLTIFYNGTVAVFDLSRDKAETILKIAEKGIVDPMVDPKVASAEQQQQLFGTLDLPIARRKSLERFLEKRKERLTSLFPYNYSCATEKQRF